MVSTTRKQTPAFEDAVETARAGDLSPEEAADLLLDQLSSKELLGLLDGDLPIWNLGRLARLMEQRPLVAGAVPRLGIPGIRFSDGPRGVTVGRSTSFPVAVARAATWDPDLEEQVGQAMGREARAQGANFSGAACVNLLRHPAWGRAQEGYGEDPVLIGRMGAALTRGLRPNVMACVKHFALNSMENARFTIDVEADEHALHEVYLPHFKTVINAGADSVMSAYNSVNGTWAGDNKTLLTTILRDEWGFRGTVISDFVFGLRDPVGSVEAGLDVEMPLRQQRARALPKALRDGRLSRDAVRRAGRRILAMQIRHAAQRDPEAPDRGTVASAQHRALARLVAARGAVLLKNEPVADAPVLPLNMTALRSLVVVGQLATTENLGDTGSSMVEPPSTSSVLQGLQEALPHGQVTHTAGADVAASVLAAQEADAAVVVVGLRSGDEGERILPPDGESLGLLGFPFNLRPLRWLMSKLPAANGGKFVGGGDRASLRLREEDEELVRAVAAGNPRTVVVVIGGSAILMENWREKVPAIVMAWYPGMEGGRAVADVLLGVEEPGGRLPFAIPTDAWHLPYFDAEAKHIVYDAWWGQRQLDRDGHPAAFPFGHGLGYSTFTFQLVHHLAGQTAGTAKVRVHSTGDRAGATVVQVYAFDEEAPRPVFQLLGFQRVALAAGAQADVEVELDLTPIRQRDPESRTWSPRPGSWQIVTAAAAPQAATVTGSRPLLSDDD